MRVRKGDRVIVISGKDKGKTGVIIASIPKEKKVVVDGVNKAKKHVRKSQQNSGGIVEIEKAIPVCTVMIICNKCGKTRVGYIFEGGKKVRVCKKCKSKI